MTADGRNGVSLDTIHALLVGTGQQLGRVEGQVEEQSKRTASIERDVAMIRDSDVQQRLSLAAIQQMCARRGEHCERRFKRISADVGMVKEDTGVIHLDHVKEQASRSATWKIITAIGAAVVAAGGLVAAMWSAIWR